MGPSDALSTAYALITLSAHSDHAAAGPAAHGAAHLLTQQRPDGSIAGRPHPPADDSGALRRG
ncbi:hypothetical protein Scani_27570 [Streptomyces caniferus]|uniref:Uncharacterized protein n=1 Tax=Streptomyces caniferus TaxID=285557 RepID=A0A640S5J3_9ACTN|nr:hypothetical protein Scani_27570 [Streptomyces caniferus]